MAVRVLVCGGAGYIGSHTVRLLLQQGQEVGVLDDLSTGHLEAVPPGVPFYQVSLLDREKTETVIRRFQPQLVMHFAAASLVGESMVDPGKYYRNNVIGAINLFDGMLQAGVKCLVFSSTAAVYGEPEKIPIPESSPCRPTSAYGRTKRMIEEIMADYDQAYGLKYVSLRYFNACGADPKGDIGEDHWPETHLIPVLMEVINGRREKVEVFGDDYPTPDGTCIRDYIHVCDLARAHLLAMEYLLGEQQSDIFNLGTGCGFSVRQIIAAVEKVTGRQIKWVVGKRRPGDPAVLVAASEKAARVLGWEPCYRNIEEIVATAWEWHRRHPGGYADRGNTFKGGGRDGNWGKR